MYFDYNATTPVHPEVVELMNTYSLQEFGNAGSVHSFGLRAHNGMDYGRKAAAAALGVSPTEVIFTSGGTEADNLALQGTFFRYRERHPTKNPHIIISELEHPAVWETAKFLEIQGAEITRIPVDEYGRVNPKDIEAAIRPNTSLISIMYANNEIGTINPIEKIGEIAQKSNILFHTDAVQAFGKVPIHARVEKISMLSVSAHKLYGPKGVGFLFVENDPDAQNNENTAFRHIRPLFFGGSQEFGLRPATENIPGIVGMGKAIEITQRDLAQEQSRLEGLRNYMTAHIINQIPNTSLNGHPKERLPNNVNICFHGICAYDLMVHLDAQGVACSVGAACHAGEMAPSRVLLALGLSPQDAESSMRFSFGLWTRQEEIDNLLSLLDHLIPKLL